MTGGEEIIKWIVGIGPGIAGGAVKYFHELSKSEDKQFKAKILFLQLFVAGVVGSWTYGLVTSIDYFIIRPSLGGTIIGLSGFLSPHILEIIEKRIPKKIDDKLKKL